VAVETVVLVLTDVQGSTRLWQDEPAAMDKAMARHHEIVHEAVAKHAGWRPVDQGEGDGVFAAFRSPTAALEAVAQVQRELAAEHWPTSVPLRVRIGVHLGEVTERAGNLYGDPVNRCARLRGLGHGGQTLLSAPVYEVVRDQLPQGATVTDLGEHRMKDLTRPEHIWQLDLDGLPSDHPPLTSLDRVRHNLPVQATPFIGREPELKRLVAAAREHRLVTLTGFGGMGKTRTALQAAAELVGDPVAGEVFFVDLSGVTRVDDVPARIAEATGTRHEGDPLAALVLAWADAPVLLVLDNLEQVLGCAPFVAELLARTAQVRVLATSREALRLRAEQVIPLTPMMVPSGSDPADLLALDTFEAVRFFLDRARAVKPEFAVTNDNAPAVAAVCARLDGHPLALELAASRLRMMSVEALRSRLESALKVLTGGSRDMPERHQTLRATIAWSYEGLADDQRLLLSRLSCLPGPADFELVETACGGDLDVFDSLEVLVDRSLVRTSEGEDAQTRYGLLVSIRDYAAEHLDPAEAADVQDRHADHVLALAIAAFDGDVAFADVAFVRREVAHVRDALAHLAADDDPTRYVQLARAVGEALYKNNLVVEAKHHVARALTFDSPPKVRAQLMLSQLFMSRDRADVGPAVDAARASGDSDLLASALISSLDCAQSVAEVNARLTELDPLLPPETQAVGTGDARAELVNVLSASLRYVDPAEAVQRLRRLEPERRVEGWGVFRVRLTRILLDHGQTEAAAEALGDGESPADFNGILGWLHAARAERGRVLCAQGVPAAAIALAGPALEELAAAQSFPHYAAIAMVGSCTAAGRHEEVVQAIDLARTVPARPELDAALGWRRAHALLQLGHLDRCRQELEVARTVLAHAELAGPRELLGCLVTEALLVHEDDPARAALLLGSVAGHRQTNFGRWVLPHGTDRDVERLEPLLLPGQQAAYDQGLSITPQDVVLARPW